ncbi:MAG: hypothetical protein A3H35_01045 [Betaproteobacteria bacterium RIFCSPLOWO2_02_FULL_62_17]|nr:MAG: hypothetical protein A3H35_01045 [Betaproteobacteria bacterium RIFCSPLOWO2_02_FULL_62_17]
MKPISTIGAEEARKAFPALIEQARQGKTTLVTKHGRPCAVIAPPDALTAKPAGADILQLRGTGKGLWGRSAARTIDRLRREWDRD